MAPLKATKGVVLVAFHDACIPMIRFNKCLIDITSIHVRKMVQKLQFKTWKFLMYLSWDGMCFTEVGIALKV